MQGKHKHCLPQNWMLGVLKVYLETALLRPHQTIKVCTDSSSLEGHFQLHFHFYMSSFPVTFTMVYPSFPLRHYGKTNVNYMEQLLFLHVLFSLFL